MSNAQRAAQQVQRAYFNDDTSTTEEYVSARSPDSWKSTSISGLEDWCSVGSGTTLDDFKSLEEDFAEGYISEDSTDDLPSLSQSTPVPPALKDDEKKEYAAVVGIHDPKKQKFSANIQPGVSAVPANGTERPSSSGTATGGAPSQIRAKLQTDKPIPPVDRELMVVSPKQSSSFEPQKYSSVITKTESTDVKTEVKTSYAMQTSIKAGGVHQTFTSNKTENIQLHEAKAPEKVEKIHKIVVMDEPKWETAKPAEMARFPTRLTMQGESKANLISELEGLKAKYFKSTPQVPPTSRESKTENVSYGFSAYPSTKDSDGRTTDVSKVVYSKEVTESHSSTSISFQQQSFGANRMEKWQSVTPQVKALPAAAVSKEAPMSKEMEEKFKKLEQDIKEVRFLYHIYQKILQSI